LERAVRRIEPGGKVTPMRKLLILVLAVPFILCACFDSDDPEGPDGNGDTSPYSGSFICSSAFVSSDCDYPAVAPPSTIDILIDGDVLMVEAATGVWDDNLKSGTATSAQICVPIGTPLDCVRCADYSFSIEFANPDSLWGTYTVTYQYSVECGTDECHTTYSIEAVR
jgi:hypothetical protein